MRPIRTKVDFRRWVYQQLAIHNHSPSALALKASHVLDFSNYEGDSRFGQLRALAEETRNFYYKAYYSQSPFLKDFLDANTNQLS